MEERERKFYYIPIFDDDWANIDELLQLMPPEPIKIDDGGPIATTDGCCGGLIINPPDELVGTILTYGAIGGVYVLKDDFCRDKIETEMKV
jgi:hypothetical protein